MIYILRNFNQNINFLFIKKLIFFYVNFLLLPKFLTPSNKKNSLIYKKELCKQLGEQKVIHIGISFFESVCMKFCFLYTIILNPINILY